MGQTNHDIQVKAVRSEFLKWDQAVMTARFNLKSDSARIYIRFFGTEYSIDRETAEVLRVTGGEPAGFNEVLSIYDVLCDTKDGAHLSGEWQTLANLSPHSNFGSSRGSLYGTEEKRLAGKTAELRRACAALGGQEQTKADVGFRFDAFDFLPIIFQFWDGDDEFEPRINFLFDSNTLDYMHFETAWYVAGHLLDLIRRELGTSGSM